MINKVVVMSFPKKKECQLTTDTLFRYEECYFSFHSFCCIFYLFLLCLFYVFISFSFSFFSLRKKVLQHLVLDKAKDKIQASSLIFVAWLKLHIDF
jgi:hypothetical protein